MLADTTVVKKKKQFVTRDRAGTFSVTLPWPAKVVRTIKQKTLVLELHAKSGKASVDITIAEWSSADFLRETRLAQTVEKMRKGLADGLEMPFETVGGSSTGSTPAWCGRRASSRSDSGVSRPGWELTEAPGVWCRSSALTRPARRS